MDPRWLVGQGVLFLSVGTDEVARLAPLLRNVKRLGARLSLVHHTGDPPTSLSAVVSRIHRLGMPPADQLVREARVKLRLGTLGRGPGSEDFARVVRRDPGLAPFLEGVDVVVPVGPVGPGVERTLELAPGLAVLTADQLRTGVVAQRLDVLVPQLLATGRPREVRFGGRWLHELLSLPADGVRVEEPAGPSEDLTRSLVPRRRMTLLSLIERLHHDGEFTTALDLCHDLRRHGGLLPEDEDAELGALQTIVRMSARGGAVPETGRVAQSVLDAADRALQAGDVAAVHRRLNHALGLLFHRELHADSESSPLVTHPREFLGALRASATGRLLARAVPRHAPGGAHPHEPSAAQELTVLPGSYGRFVRPLLDKLSERVPTTVVDLTTRGTYAGLGVNSVAVRDRLDDALSGGSEPVYELLEAMARSRVVWVDWADRGAAQAVTHVPPGVRLVLRMHGMDALSPWIHLLDWSRVDDLVLVSEHLRDLVESLLGDRLAGTRVHVVPNVVDAAPFETTKELGAERTLGMVGWAQRVKDPLWTVEVLAALRAVDASWRLLLVGTDFTPGRVTSAQEYVAAFRERISRSDVVGGIDFVDYTRDLPRYVRRMGFAVSSSRRESFAVGLAEAAASGAVPVVRDWPMFPGAAARVFPAQWVVGSVDQAAERILQLADAEARREAGEQARREVLDRYPAQAVLSTLASLATGPVS